MDDVREDGGVGSSVDVVAILFVVLFVVVTVEVAFDNKYCRIDDDEERRCDDDFNISNAIVDEDRLLSLSLILLLLLLFVATSVCAKATNSYGFNQSPLSSNDSIDEERYREKHHKGFFVYKTILL